MNNLKKLIEIRTDKNCDELLDFLSVELKNKVEDIRIFEENKVKVMIVGINTKLEGVWPHRTFRTHRYS